MFPETVETCFHFTLNGYSGGTLVLEGGSRRSGDDDCEYFRETTLRRRYVYIAAGKTLNLLEQQLSNRGRAGGETQFNNTTYIRTVELVVTKTVGR